MKQYIHFVSIFAVIAILVGGIGLVASHGVQAQSGEEGGAQDSAQPNIVYVMADDLGYADLNPEDMPRSYEIFTERGTQMPFHAMQNCAPSRTSLMTGKDASRMGMHGVDQVMIMQQPGFGVPAEEILLPERLRDLGYTTGAFGKWHIGLRPDQHPQNNGFDEFAGFLYGFINYYGPQADGNIYSDQSFGHDHHGEKRVINGVKKLFTHGHDLEYNGVPLHSQTYSTFLFGNAGEAFIRDKAKRDEPYFAYVAFNAPHTPYSAPRRYVDIYKERFSITAEDEAVLKVYANDVLGVPWDYQYENSEEGKSQKDRLNNLLYYASVRALDDALGDLYETVEKTGESDNTIFIFVSDNGAGSGNVKGDNGHLRAGKGSPYEGGHRVANFIIWPDQIEVGQEISDNIWIGDIYPTFIDAAGGDIPDDLEGVSVLGVLQGSDRVMRNHNGVWMRNGSSADFVSHISKKMYGEEYDIEGNVTKYKELAQIAILNYDTKYIKTLTTYRTAEVDADGNEERAPLVDTNGELVIETREELYKINDNQPNAGESTNLMNDPRFATLRDRMRNKYDRYGFGGTTGDDYLIGLKSFYSTRVIPREYYNSFVQPYEWTNYDLDENATREILKGNIF